MNYEDRPIDKVHEGREYVELRAKNQELERRADYAMTCIDRIYVHLIGAYLLGVAAVIIGLYIMIVVD